MFEGKRPFSTEESASPADSDGARALRPLHWDELAARIGAAQDLRSFIGGRDVGSEASFDALSARWLAEHGGVPDQNGKFPVNPLASANCKGPGGKSLPTSSARLRSRGNT
jgi:hypothetical protein